MCSYHTSAKRYAAIPRNPISNYSSRVCIMKPIQVHSKLPKTTSDVRHQSNGSLTFQIDTHYSSISRRRVQYFSIDSVLLSFLNTASIMLLSTTGILPVCTALRYDSKTALLCRALPYPW